MEQFSEQIFLPPPWMWLDRIVYTAPYCTPLHQHPCWQLTVSLSGSFLPAAQDQTWTLEPGSWILLPPGMFHVFQSRDIHSEALQIFFRRFPAELMPDTASRFNLCRNRAFTGHGMPETFTGIYRQLCDRSSKNIPLDQSFRICAGLNLLLSALETLQPKELPPSGSNHPAIQTALEFMEQHFAEPVGIPEIAAASGLGTSRFSEIFRSKAGISPMHFLNDLRLCRACELLLAGVSAAECARRTGFRSPQYFNRFFRRHIGKTPAEFQQNPDYSGFNH